MPSGKTHDSIAWYFSIPFAYLVWYFSHDLSVVVFYIISYFFSNLMFSGDLDLVSIQSKRWGFFRWIWIPYRKFIPHRSRWSHGIFLGTVFRIFYVGCFISAFYYSLYLSTKYYLPQYNKLLLNSTNQGMTFLSHQHPVYFLVIFLGLLTGSLLHTSADVTVSAIKNLRRKFKKKKRHKKSKLRKG